VFAGLIGVFLKQPNPKILDWGCGLGNLAPVCYHFVKDGGQYTGIDIDKTSIDACLDTYKDLRNCRFIRSTDSNDFYKQQDRLNKDNTSIVWPVENHSQDLVIAVSVFTHIQEPDAVRYMAKIHEVLVDGGIAMLTFLVARKFQNPQPVFTFSYPLASPGWFTSRPDCPEEAVAVTEEALAKLLGSRFKIIHRIEGQCSGGKGPSLQEILVLKACAT
jgi:SAM-dependent methyltransferase